MIKLLPLTIGNAFGCGAIYIPRIQVNWEETAKHLEKRRHTFKRGRSDSVAP